MNLETAASTTVPPIAVTDVAETFDASRQDAVSLHRHLFAEGSLDRMEAEALFDLERVALRRCEAWTTFFIQAVTDHVVWGARPTGRLDEEQADWLLAQVDATRTPASFAILVNVIDEAQTLPPWFASAVRSRAGWPGVSHGEDTFWSPSAPAVEGAGAVSL